MENLDSIFRLRPMSISEHAALVDAINPFAPRKTEAEYDAAERKVVIDRMLKPSPLWERMKKAGLV